jgi:hypothetical protein
VKLRLLVLTLIALSAQAQSIIPVMIGINTKPTSQVLTLIRVNAGGSSYTDTAGHVWGAESNADNEGDPDFNYPSTQTITGTSDQTLYNTSHYGSGTLDYNFTVTNGTYTITLKFAELYWGFSGQRLFDVQINGSTVLSSFDIVGEAGPTAALDKSFNITVTTGTINLHMSSSVDNPTINGIELRQTSSSGGGGGGGGGGGTLESMVGSNNPNTPAAPAGSGGYTGGGTASTFSACTGVANTDTTAVQNSINALSSGQSLKMTCKALINSSGITISGKTNIKFWGTGLGTGLQATSTTGLTSSGGFAGSAMIKIVNCTDCLVTGLDFDSNGIAVTAFLLDSSLRTEVNGNYMHNVGCTVSGSDCSPSAIVLGDGNNNTRYIGNTVYTSAGCGTNCNGVRGMWLRESGTLEWGNTVYGTGGTGQPCNCRDLQQAYNFVHDVSGGSGLKLSGAGGPANQNVGTTDIHHNLVDNTNQFIRLEETATTSTLKIRDNEARNMVGPGGTAGDGIYANSSPMNNTQITHNYFHGITGAAVKLLSGLSNYLIQDNQFSSNGTGIHIGEVGGTFSSITVNRNDMRTNTIGIKLQNNGNPSIGLAVTNNAFVGGTYGLNIDSGITGTISQSGNCWINTTNISDGRGVLSNPGSSGSCSNPILP